MAGFTRSVVIERPVEQVFDFATDLNHAALFLPNVTEVELLTEGGMRPGARFRETRLMRGKPQTAVIEVLEHERPTVHAARSAMLGMQACYRFTFSPHAAGTRVDLQAQVTGNLLWWPLLGLISRYMEQEDGQYLERLKTAMESTQPG